MTITLPCRLITRQRSHMAFTEGRTFIRLTFPLLVKLGHAETRTYRGRAGHYTTPRRVAHGTRTLVGMVRILGPCAVIATVCSKCAASEPSAVEIDQSSSCTYTS